ncbi:MAG: hypothetical protein PHO00_00755 [bacterium]|nr:hypothetical protein [bacterium]
MRFIRRLPVFFLCLFLFAGYADSKDVVLKTLVVNPSKTKTQSALLKAYLPKEAKPGDIKELGDLKIDYDIEKSLYYVYKMFELGPGESESREITIDDIWVIPAETIDALNTLALEYVKVLRDSEFYDSAAETQRDIEEKSRQILLKQQEAMDAQPQTHIAVYRENMKELEKMRDMLAKMEKNAGKAGSVSAGGAGGSFVSAERISVKASWWLILGVIVFLGFMSLVFFVVWHKQVGESERGGEKEITKPVSGEKESGQAEKQEKE